MKSKEELNDLKNEVNTMNKKLAELTEKDLEQVTGSQKMCVNHCTVELEGLNNPNRHTKEIDEQSKKISTGKTINREEGAPASYAISNQIEEEMRRLKQER